MDPLWSTLVVNKSVALKSIVVVVAVMVLGGGVARVISAESAAFLGAVAVEWDDSDSFNRHKLKLLSDFGFRDGQGKQWVARKGAELDGSSFTPVFEQMVGLPFVGEHRRAGIIHDYYAKQLTDNWKDVRRMYYAALMAEGLGENEAKIAYAVLYGAGMRWEVKGSTCYINCHSSATSLAWKPDVTETELETALDVLGEGNPSLDEIDRAVDAVVVKPGPHLFSQLRKKDAAEEEMQEVEIKEDLPMEDPPATKSPVSDGEKGR